MIKEIIKDEEFLKQPAEPATPEDAEVAQDLLDTMAAQESCACLAANQIGVNKAIIVYDDNETPRVMYNPRIKSAMRPYKATETCLSLDKDSEVTRFFDVKVIYEELVDGNLLQREVRLRDWVAQIVQHAIDHCKGRLV